MDSRKTAVAVLVVVVVAGGLWLRHYFSPGEVVKRKMFAMIEAFEEERILGVMASVSRGYSDPWGFSYETLAGNLHQVMDTYEDLDVDLVIGDVEAADEQVRIGLEFVVWGKYDGTKGYVVGSVSEPCSAVVEWRKETPGWRFATTVDLDIPELREELESRRPR